MSWNGVKKQTNIEDIKAWCEEMGIKDYTINSKGEIDVNDCVEFKYNSHNDFKELPYKFGMINGFFSLDKCKNLISLKNCPNYINFSFYCDDCSNLESLEGCPKEVGRDFKMRRSKIQLSKDDIIKICKVKKEDIYI